MKFIIKVYIALFITILLSIVYLYKSLYATEAELNKNMEDLFITQAREIASNISQHLHKHLHHNAYLELKKQPKLRESMEHSLTTVITDCYKYVYVLYRDKEGNFRFLLDGSKKDKGEFGEKFSVMSPKWDYVYKTQQSAIIYQDKVNTLWVTYLSPFVIDGKTEAIIAIDFSVGFPKSVKAATEPMRDVLIYIFVAIGLLLLILLYQTILNYKTKKESFVDPLTQVYNRHYLREFLNNIDSDSYQIIMFDIDYFKKVNDHYGHDAGDYILQEVANHIRNEIRIDDILVRFGGEEFLLFIKKDNKNINMAIEIAQRIRANLEQEEFIFNDMKIYLTLSAGIALHLEHFKSINEAIKHADNMLYIAKREGRNRVVFSASNKSEHLNIREINDIKEAIETKNLFCEFQAIYDVKTRRVAKYEALVRLRDHDGTIIYPKEFLETVVHTAVYRDMTKAILNIVFETIKRESVYISLNLNFSDILDDNIFELIIDELHSHENMAQWLTIELLEYEPLDENEIVKKRLQKIKNYGVKIAIDDFGSGYANYDIFNFVPVDIIKIDALLIKKIDKSELSYSIVKSIATLAEELDIEVVAEFVASKEIFDVIEELGITYAQGFYFAKPEEKIIR